MKNSFFTDLGVCNDPRHKISWVRHWMGENWSIWYRETKHTHTIHVSPQDWGIWSVWIIIRWIPMISALRQGDNNLKNCDKPYVHDEEYQEQQETPYFHASTTAREWRRENMGFVVFFGKYKIGNNDFTTILVSRMKWIDVKLIVYGSVIYPQRTNMTSA